MDFLFYFISHICYRCVIDDATTEVSEKQILSCYCHFYDCTMTIFMLLSRADFDVDIKHEWRVRQKMMMGFKEVEVEIDDSFTHEKDFFHFGVEKLLQTAKKERKIIASHTG